MNRYLVAALATAGLVFGLNLVAQAADLAPMAPAAAPVYVKAPVVAPFNWTGFYVGGHVGGDWGKVKVLNDVNDGVPPGPFKYNAAGVFGGGTVGYNLQIQNFVVGVEGDVGFMDLSGAGIVPSSNPAAHQDITLGHGAYGDITGRLGYAVDRTLVYAKGGVAFYDGEARQTTTNPGYVTTGTRMFTGWTAGGGVEHFIAPNWSIKAEYQHFDFGSQIGNQTSVTDPPIGHVYHNWTTLNADSVKAGVNWHF